MQKIIAILALALLTIGLSAQGKVDFLYAGINMRLPAGFQLLADLGTNGNVMVFRYGKKKGEKYITFADISNDNTIDFHCPVSVFYGKVFLKNTADSCNLEYVNIVRSSLFENRQVESIELDGFSVNLSFGADKSYAFIITKDSRVIKIDTDFLGRRAFKAIFK